MRSSTPRCSTAIALPACTDDAPQLPPWSMARRIAGTVLEARRHAVRVELALPVRAQDRVHPAEQSNSRESSELSEARGKVCRAAALGAGGAGKW